MSQIVFNVPAMLLVLVLMTLAGSPSSMTCTTASPPTTMKRPTAGRGFSSSCSARSMALRVALSFGHCLAPSVQTAMSVCEIMIEQPQLPHDWRRLV
jgi:hypothetical protein